MDTNRTSGIVRRIPIFQGFTPEQIGCMLEVCEERSFEEGQSLFLEGDPSAEMHILLSGYLNVTTSTGAEIASIGEMGLVGEMGVLTGQPRSANVVARRPSTTLSISRDSLFRLIETDRDMGFKIYRNVTTILCDRLRDNNILVEQQYLILEDLTEQE